MKPVSERVAAYRNRQKEMGRKLCQVYAHSQDHKAIRQFSSELNKKREDENVAIDTKISL